MKHPITQTRNGIAVYVDLVHSQAATRIAHQPHLLGLVKEFVEKTSVKAPELSVEEDMGRPIGYSFVVETTDKDTVLYAQPVHSNTYMRFVKNGTPAPSQYLSVILQRDQDGSYELLDAWIGQLHPPRPGSTEETATSKSFWATHAFVLDGQPIQLRTVTKICPY